MAFTTIAAVQALLGSRNYDQKTDLQQFIDSADVIMLRVQNCASTQKNIILSTRELEIIERWLAAHMYCQMDMLFQNKSTLQSSATFQGQTGLALDSTRYGQTAVNLDVSGCLNAIGKRSFVSANWLGKPQNDRLPWQDRVSSAPGGDTNTTIGG